MEAAVVVEHHPPELRRLDVVLVQHQRLLEALHGQLKLPQLPTGKVENGDVINTSKLCTRGGERLPFEGPFQI